MKSDLNRYIDLQYLAVTTLVRNKDKLVKLMRSVSAGSFDVTGFPVSAISTSAVAARADISCGVIPVATATADPA